jgi:hypothetical protein
MLPFQNPTFEPLRHLFTESDPVDSIAMPLNKNIISLNLKSGVLLEWGDLISKELMEKKALSTEQAKEISDVIILSCFTTAQEEIIKNKIPGWGPATSFAIQRIQQPFVTVEKLMEIAPKILQQYGVDQPTRLGLSALIVNAPSITAETPALEPINKLAQTVDQVRAFQSKSTQKNSLTPRPPN